VSWPMACWLGALATFIVLSSSPMGDPSSVAYPKLNAALVDHVLYLVFCLLVVAPLTVPEARSRIVVATLSNPVARFIGRISYGVFLWHFVVLAVYTGGEVGATGFWVTLAVVLPVTVAIALASYYLIERPALRLRPLLGGAPADPSIVTSPASVGVGSRP
jgi:peptidoglycan/LPS O-acetylase OafA/YrhL